MYLFRPFELKDKEQVIELLHVLWVFSSEEEYERRNIKRMGEENKNLPMHIVKNMISSYQAVREEEGFNKIISL